MEMSDIINLLDKKFSGANAVPCPNEGKPVKSQNGNAYKEHGGLGVHKSGSMLICGRCGYNEPIGRPE